MQKTLRDIAEIRAKPLPTTEELQAAAQRAKQAVADLALMKNARWTRNLAVQAAEARLRQRLQFIAQRTEVGLVWQIRKKLGVEPADQSTPNSTSSAS